jgi:cellulose synthase/poly-beta-1,6-N-acetylglucosamine synthase-like glycosyltransferase
MIGEEDVLRALGFGKPQIALFADRAARNGTTIEQELLADGSIEPDAYYAAMARLLRLPFLQSLDPDRIVDSPYLDIQLIRPMTVRLTHPRRAPVTVIVPEARRLKDLAVMLERLPSLRADMAVAAPTAVRQAVWSVGAARRVRETVRALFDWRPQFSARITFWGKQGFYAGFAVSALLVAAVIAPELTLACAHCTMSLFYFAAMVLRIAALRTRKRPAARMQELPAAENLPVYTVMVALYKEAALAGQLVSTLGRLHWPRARLDIKIVCEADDRDTIDAVRAANPGPQFEIVEVPPYQPRTKPKALCYALAAARGTYLAIYDAEDRPHPDQLLEAYGKFCASPDNVVCLQAPLIISNAQQSWISALFSLEYSALFRRMLPMLARLRMPMPLGGTSNHFKTDVLRACGGWDPFNVTEDADLGMRLYRLGYRSDVIHRPTLEDAPTNATIWTAQRTRWFKGWLQTWLVLMRAPNTVRREMGTRAFAMFHLLIGGMLISSLTHVFILVFLSIGIAALLKPPGQGLPLRDTFLLMVDGANILGSYATFLALGLTAMTGHEKKLVGRRWSGIPIYWMMSSWAAWRAVFELQSKPFFWAKTPHMPRGRTTALDKPALE